MLWQKISPPSHASPRRGDKRSVKSYLPERTGGDHRGWDIPLWTPPEGPIRDYDQTSSRLPLRSWSELGVRISSATMSQDSNIVSFFGAWPDHE